MADAEHPVNVVSNTLKNAIAALRDLVVFLIVVLLFVSPTTVRDRLESAGIQAVGPTGIEWRAAAKTAADQTKSAGADVDQARKDNEALVARIKELESKVTSPEAKAAVREISESAAASQVKLDSADKVLKRSLARQQEIVAQVAPESVAATGWIYLGKVSEDRSQWVEGSPKTVQALAPKSLDGGTLAVRDDVYIRSDSGEGARATAPVIGVAKVGETLEVTKVDYSHARGGGWFVWTRVRRS